jgi:glucosamine-6-phosphate isomerase
MINKIIYRDYEELSVETAKLITQIIRDKPDALLCFPAGETSLGTFQELVKIHLAHEADFSQCKIVGLDEWVESGVMKSENCFHFLKKHLFDPIGFKSENMCFFDGEAQDLQNECLLSDQFIKTNGGIDIMLLGLGMNGHIGLNEPGTNFDAYSHVVELDELTKNVAQKYFSLKTSLSQGITLGMKHVMEARTVILQVSGQKKSAIVKRLLETEITNDFPASLVQKHSNAYLLLDPEAAQV